MARKPQGLLTRLSLFLAVHSDGLVGALVLAALLILRLLWK
jgi:hypothetical protein